MMKILVQFACIAVINANLDHYAWKPKMTPSAEELLIEEGDELRLICQGEGRLQFSAPSYEYSLTTHSGSTGSFDTDSKTNTFVIPKTVRGDTGWYACAEENVPIFNNELTIDHPGEEIRWIYVYVNSSRPFAADGAEIHYVYGWIASRIIIPCRTTSPNLPVILEFFWGDAWELEAAYHDPKIGFITNYFYNGVQRLYRCRTNGADKEHWYQLTNYAVVTRKRTLHDPIIEKDPIGRVLRGEDITLNCKVKVSRNTEIRMSWTVPDSVPRERLHFYDLSKQSLYQRNSRLRDTWDATLTIKNVSKIDGGHYICGVLDGNNNGATSSVEIQIQDPSYEFIDVNVQDKREISKYEGEYADWSIKIDSYPHIDELYWSNPNGIRINYTEDYSKYTYWRYGIYYYFRILDLVIEDSGNYTIHVSTSHNETSIKLRLTVLRSGPTVFIKYIKPYFAPRQSAEVVCDSQSNYTVPNITWSYKEYPDFPSEENIVYRPFSNIPKEEIGERHPHRYRFILISRLNITINMTGDVVCSSCDANSCTEFSSRVLVSDIAERFGIVGPHIVTEGDDANLTCSASVYDFTDRIWWRRRRGPGFMKNQIRENSLSNNTRFTYQIVLHLRDVRKSQAGIYVCKAVTKFDGIEITSHKLIIKKALPPQFTGLHGNDSGMLIDLETDKPKTVLLECLADGWPIPEVTWWKNDVILIEGEQYELSQNNSVLEIKNFSESDGGRYTCYATNRVGEVQKYTDIKIAGEKTHIAVWPVVSVAVGSLLIMIVWMRFRKRREMASRQRFMEATLQRFNVGALDCLDPELNMAEQAELLPYNKKWEFPRELLKFGKELGSGAFGVVKMAQAKSICQSEAVTTVAVKVVRSTANLNQMTALQRELKILAYLGKHLNVVNLLGACTKHVSFGQLLVIVEFCRFGNTRDYLVRHRADFVGQTVNVTEDTDTDSSDAENHHTADDNDGSRVSCDVSTTTAGFCRDMDSTDQSPALDDRVPEPDPLEQSQRINYQGDYEDENLEPISTRDLLSWAWQVARGMKFLSLRRILHGDLAARNILLADHNVVKICDFGMAKTLFTDDNYQQIGTDPLPYKWMAIESLKDRVFSVHSDVWSYGVVLWEFYSLAKTPYSGIKPKTLPEKLAEGFRMAQPEHATPEIYEVMLHCWNAEPFQRPSFAKLVEDISLLLEDSVKMDYFDLDASYVRMTADALEQGEPDFLTMNTSEVILNTNQQTQA